MVDDVLVFQNSEFGEIRIVNHDGEPWFVAADVCKILGHSNPTVAMESLEDFEKAKLSLGLSGGETNVISESGFYALVLRSRKPIAKPFRIWVTSVVLSQIRKTGGYIPATTNSVTLTDEQIMAQALMIAQKTLALRDEQLQQANAQVQQMLPKAEYYDNVLNAKNLITTTEIAKYDYGMSAIALNKLLCDWGIQFKRGSKYYLYAQYDDLGYNGSKTVTWVSDTGHAGATSHMMWTQAGRQFIHEQMKAHGYMTTAEKAQNVQTLFG